MIARIASLGGLRERWTPDGRHIVEDAGGRVVIDEHGTCPFVPFEWWREPKETWLRFGASTQSITLMDDEWRWNEVMAKWVRLPPRPPPKLRGLAALGLGLVSRE